MYYWQRWKGWRSGLPIPDLDNFNCYWVLLENYLFVNDGSLKKMSLVIFTVFMRKQRQFKIHRRNYYKISKICISSRVMKSATTTKNKYFK